MADSLRMRYVRRLRVQVAELESQAAREVHPPTVDLFTSAQSMFIKPSFLSNLFHL